MFLGTDDDAEVGVGETQRRRCVPKFVVLSVYRLGMGWGASPLEAVLSGVLVWNPDRRKRRQAPKMILHLILPLGDKIQGGKDVFAEMIFRSIQMKSPQPPSLVRPNACMKFARRKWRFPH